MKNGILLSSPSVKAQSFLVTPHSMHNHDQHLTHTPPRLLQQNQTKPNNQTAHSYNSPLSPLPAPPFPLTKPQTPPPTPTPSPPPTKNPLHPIAIPHPSLSGTTEKAISISSFASLSPTPPHPPPIIPSPPPYNNSFSHRYIMKTPSAKTLKKMRQSESSTAQIPSANMRKN